MPSAGATVTPTTRVTGGQARRGRGKAREENVEDAFETDHGENWWGGGGRKWAEPNRKSQPVTLLLPYNDSPGYSRGEKITTPWGEGWLHRVFFFSTRTYVHSTIHALPRTNIRGQ